MPALLRCVFGLMVKSDAACAHAKLDAAICSTYEAEHYSKRARVGNLIDGRLYNMQKHYMMEQLLYVRLLFQNQRTGAGHRKPAHSDTTWR